jgi:hypothetical protein
MIGFGDCDCIDVNPGCIPVVDAPHTTWCSVKEWIDILGQSLLLLLSAVWMVVEYNEYWV